MLAFPALSCCWRCYVKIAMFVSASNNRKLAVMLPFGPIVPPNTALPSFFVIIFHRARSGLQALTILSPSRNFPFGTQRMEKMQPHGA